MTTPLIETMARAVAERLEAFDIHGIPQAALTAITEAGYAVAPVEPTEVMIEAGYASLEAMDLFDEGACTVVTAYRAMINAVTHCNNNGKAE